jgi:hypothetical protein
MSDYTLRDLLVHGCSLNEATRLLYSGLLDQQTYDRFCTVADWAAARFTGTAGVKQERFWRRFGKDAYLRRIARMKALHDRIRDGKAKIT